MNITDLDGFTLLKVAIYKMAQEDLQSNPDDGTHTLKESIENIFEQSADMDLTSDDVMSVESIFK